MKTKILVLGAGFGGLELATMLSEALGEQLDLTLIDKNDSFVFGFSKLDVMFHRTEPSTIRSYYMDIVKPGVRFVQDTVESIDPAAKKVTTTNGVYEADVLVVALGADYDIAATPGLAEAGNEFYSVAGALRIRDLLPNFTKGNAIIGVTSTPFKCPPGPCEAALMLHDFLTTRGVRDACHITFVTPFRVPIPPSPETSKALMDAFKERGIMFIPNHRVQSLDGTRRMAILDDGTELPYDLFLGIPKHCVPSVVADSGIAEDGWVLVDPKNLRTKYENVYAIGDVCNAGVPKAGLFAEGAARVVAASILRDLHGGPEPAAYTGSGSCYIEYGADKVGRVDIDFLSGPDVTAKFYEPSKELIKEKVHFGSSRRLRWFGQVDSAE